MGTEKKACLKSLYAMYTFNLITFIIYGLHFKMQLRNLVNFFKSNIILLLTSFLFLGDMPGYFSDKG